MTAPDFQRVAEVFEQAYALALSERATFLDSACGADEALRFEVEELLAQHDDPVELATVVTEAPSSHALPFERLGRYRILEEIGRGGMGIVYRARQESPDRDVAVKVMRDVIASASAGDRFANEAKVLGRLQHVGIAQIFESGVAQIDGDGPEVSYFAMEFVEGEHLTDHVTAHSLAPPEQLSLMASICDAVQHAHTNGVVHRDLKPANILVDREGLPKILDFGVARLTADDGLTHGVKTMTGQLIGTVPYMSPEQLGGHSEEIDERSDVYALGVILFELLSGRLPLEVGALPLAEAVDIVRHRPPSTLGGLDSRFRGDVDTIVAKALMKEKQRRYASAGDLAKDIRRHLAHEPITARPVSGFYKLSKLARRHRGFAIGLALTVTTLVVGIVVSTLFALRASRNAAESRRNEDAAERRAYSAMLGAAEHRISRGDNQGAKRLLATAPTELRNWEWRYLEARIARRLIDDCMSNVAAMPVAYRPDGVPVAIRSRGSRDALVEVETGRVIVTNGPHEGESTNSWHVISCFSGDASRAVLWSEPERRLAIIATMTGEEVCVLNLSESELLDASLDGDGRTVVLLEAGALRVIDVDGKRELSRSDVDPAFGLARISSDGARVALLSSASRSMKRSANLALHDVRSGREVWSRAARGVYDVKFGPEDDEISIMWKEGLEVLDAATGELRRRHSDFAGSGNGHAFDARGFFLMARSDRVVRVRGTEDGRLLGEFGIDGMTARFAFDPSGAELAISHRRGVDLHEFESVRAPMEHETFAYQVGFHPSGDLLASIDFDGNIRLWDARSGALIDERLHAMRLPEEIVFSPDGRFLTAWSNEGVVWDLVTGQLTKPERLGDYPRGCRSRSVAKSRSGFVAKKSDTTKPVIVTHPSGVQVELEASTIPLVSMALSEDGKHMIACGWNAWLGLWDTGTGRLRAELVGHRLDCFKAVFTPDGSRVVTTGRDGLFFWDVKTGESVWQTTRHLSYIHGIDMSQDGEMLATVSGDRTVRIWDVQPDHVRRRELRERASRRSRLLPRVRAIPDAVVAWRQLCADEGLSEKDLSVALELLIARRKR